MRRTGAVIAVMVATGAVAVFAVATGGSAGAPRTQASARSGGALSEAQRRYAILRRARTDADAIVTAPQVKEDDPTGMDPSEARLARSSAPGWRVWAIPASHGICVGGLPPTMGEGYGPGSVCGGGETLRDGVVATSSAGSQGNEFFKPGEVIVFGLVPDGVEEVVLELRDGGSRRLPVVDNAFHADLAEQTKDVWYADAGGKAHHLGGASWDGIDGDA